MSPLHKDILKALKQESFRLQEELVGLRGAETPQNYREFAKRLQNYREGVKRLATVDEYINHLEGDGVIRMELYPERKPWQIQL